MIIKASMIIFSKIEYQFPYPKFVEQAKAQNYNLTRNNQREREREFS